MEHVSPELAKWLLGGLISSVVTIVGAVVFLITKSYSLGKHAAKFEQTSKEIAESKVLITEAVKKLEAIPLHDQRLGQLEQLFKKTHSDIRDLIKQVVKLETREEMRSGHDLLGNGHDD